MSEINYLILADDRGGTTYLTNQTPSSRNGIPVLTISSEDVEGDFGPADLLGHTDEPGKLYHAANVVHAWGKQPNRTEEERNAARMFLSQWPEGPQL